MTGKQFERTLLKGLRANRIFAVRIPDAYTHKGGVDYGQKTPCDFFAVKKSGDGVTPMLIEAKAESHRSIAFKRLERHQLESLVKFEDFSPKCRSYVSVVFYDPMDSRSQSMFMIPISVWTRYMEDGERKSISIDTCREDPEIIHCPRVPHRVYELSKLGR